MNNNKIYLFLVLLLFKGSLITSSSISILIRKIPAALKSTKITAPALLVGQQVRTLSDETFPSKPYESAKDYYPKQDQDFAALVQATKILTNEFSPDSRVPKFKVKVGYPFIQDHLKDSPDALLLKKASEDHKYNMNILKKNFDSLIETNNTIRALKNKTLYEKNLLKSKLETEAQIVELSSKSKKLADKVEYIQYHKDHDEFKPISEIMKRGLWKHAFLYKNGYMAADEYQEKNKDIKKLKDYLEANVDSHLILN